MSERSPWLFGLPTNAAVFVGLIAAPAIGGSLGTFLVSLISALIAGNVGDLPRIVSFSLSAGFLGGLLLGIPTSLGIGMAVHTLLLRKGLVRIRNYALFGALIGAISGLLIGFLTGTITTLEPSALLLFGVCGGIGGIVFWLIRRPDRDAVSASPIP